MVFERRTLLLMLSAGLAAGLIAFCTFESSFLFWILHSGMYMADAFFHELGHAIVSWIFGMPAIPSLLTLFGSDKAAGVTLVFPRSWIVQCMSFCAMAYGCYWVRLNYPSWLWGALALTLLAVGTAFTNYYLVVELYMGHGGAIFMGGFLLLRAWGSTFVRNGLARWFKAFFGFFIVFNNLNFAWKLMMNAQFREEYVSPSLGGDIDNDFVQIVDHVWRWNIEGIALFTVGYCVLALIVPLLLAKYWEEDEAL